MIFAFSILCVPRAGEHIAADYLSKLRQQSDELAAEGSGIGCGEPGGLGAEEREQYRVGKMRVGCGVDGTRVREGSRGFR
jgi:hypothetical protein